MALRQVHKDEVSKIQLPEVALSEDRGLKLCGEPFPVLASISDSSYYKNDRTGVDGKFDSMEVYLEDENGNEELAPGSAVNYIPQPDNGSVSGFIIDWRQYTEVVGGVTRIKAGCYKVKIYYDIAGITGHYYWGSYRLLPYSARNAEGTSRIFVVLNGYVRETGIDYRDSGFATTLRFRGRFGERQPNYDMEDITEISRVTYTVRNESLNTYTLKSEPLLSCFTDKIDTNHLLVASQIFISDHNVFVHKQYFDQPVILDKEKSPELDYDGMGVYATITAYFKDKVKKREAKYSGDINGTANAILELPTGTQAEGCLPATNNIFQSDGTTLIESVSIPSGGVENTNIPDSPISLNGDFAQNVKATDAKNFLIQNTDGDPVGYVIFGNYEIGVSEITVNTAPFTDLPATNSLDIPVHDSAGSDVGTVNAGVVDIADTTITLNTNEVTESVLAEGSKNFNLLDKYGNALVITDYTGDDVTTDAECPFPWRGLQLLIDPNDTLSYISPETAAYSLAGVSQWDLINGVGYTSPYWTFDGVDDYISESLEFNNRLNQLSYSFWINQGDGSSSNKQIFTPSSSPRPFRLFSNSRALLVILENSGGFDVNSIADVFTLTNDNQPIQITVTVDYDLKEIKTYRQGVLIDTTIYTDNNNPLSGLYTFFIGRFSGSYDNISRGIQMLHNKVLTADEIKCIFNQTKSDYGL